MVVVTPAGQVTFAFLTINVKLTQIIACAQASLPQVGDQPQRLDRWEFT
jgi:hypothetical protein